MEDFHREFRMRQEGNAAVKVSAFTPQTYACNL